jgi:hypothetical protein
MHFQAKWIPVRVKKMRSNNELERRSDAIGSENALTFQKERRPMTTDPSDPKNETAAHLMTADQPLDEASLDAIAGGGVGDSNISAINQDGIVALAEQFDNLFTASMCQLPS